MWALLFVTGVAVYLVLRLRAVESKVAALRRSMDAQLTTKDVDFLMRALRESGECT